MRFRLPARSEDEAVADEHNARPVDRGVAASRRAAAVAAFPSYSSAEIRADGIVHGVGLTGAVVAVAFLLSTTREAGSRIGFSALVYGGGLVGMLAASAAYNLASNLPVKTRLRRLDHAMIFVMIAGSYTPFALNAMSRVEGAALCVAEWVLAAVGVALAYRAPGRHGARLRFALYLGMGWLVVLVVGPLATVLPPVRLVDLLAGGVVYTAGAFVHARGRMRFHNAIWHVMILVAAGLQFAAVEGALRVKPG